MIQLHFKGQVHPNLPLIGRKDLATVEDQKDVTCLIFTVLANVIPKSVVGLLSDLGKLPHPITLYNDNGVFIERR